MSDKKDILSLDFDELKAERELNRKKTKRDLGIPEDAKVLIFLGRISAEKNLDELVECFTEYTKTHENVYLLTVGDGPYKETLIKKVEKLGIKDRVVVHDGVSHTDIRKYYDVADVFASLLTPQMVFISEDLPTLDLPMKANSWSLAFGLSLNFSLLPAKTAFVILIFLNFVANVLKICKIIVILRNFWRKNGREDFTEPVAAEIEGCC